MTVNPTENEREEDSEVERGENADLPKKEDIVEAYIQYSEESRYRDGIMHNSYYFVLIAIVLFTGQVLSLDFTNTAMGISRLGIAVMSGGFVLAGISVVMKTYNRKRNNAEHQRQVLENILDKEFTQSGMFEIGSNKDLPTRSKDNPFAIQEMVIGKNQGFTEGLFIDTLPISFLTTLSMGIGVFGMLTGFVILLSSLLP